MLKINREILLSALSNAGLCLEPKGTIPALSFALLEMTGGNLRITGTDLDVSYQTVIEAEGNDCAFCVPAKPLTRLAGLFDGDTVSITWNQEAERAVISCGKAKYTLPGLESDAFPKAQKVDGKQFLISGGMLKKLFERAVFCVSTEESRFSMLGVLMETKNGKLHVVATDGYRAAAVKYSIPFSESVSGIVPPRAVKAAIKTLVDDDPVSVTIDNDNAKLVQGETVITARLLIGQFPKWEMIIPAERKHSVAISSEAEKIFKRSAVVADMISVSRAPGIYFNVSKDGIEVTSRHADKGESCEFIPSKCETLNGDTIPLHFASRYMTEILVLEPEVNLAFNDNGSQLLITPTGLRDYEYQYVVMPCRI